MNTAEMTTVIEDAFAKWYASPSKPWSAPEWVARTLLTALGELAPPLPIVLPLVEGVCRDLDKVGASGVAPHIAEVVASLLGGVSPESLHRAYAKGQIDRAEPLAPKIAALDKELAQSAKSGGAGPDYETPGGARAESDAPPKSKHGKSHAP